MQTRRGRRTAPAQPLAWPPATPVGPYRVGQPQSNFTREAYLTALTRIREYIRNGDVYQVNLTQRFSFPLSGEPYYLLQRLFQLNPAPFYAYLHCDDFQVLSTSMERFLYRRGDYLETRPIKGTRPRGATPAADAELRQELAESPKDDAELSMIVDLLRNDLGKVCRPRTVRVTEHKRLEAYQNVYHLVSIVTGQLQPGCTCSGYPAGHLSRGLHHRLPQDPGHGDHRRTGAPRAPRLLRGHRLPGVAPQYGPQCGHPHRHHLPGPGPFRGGGRGGL